jgi:hypothetical protein
MILLFGIKFDIADKFYFNDVQISMLFSHFSEFARLTNVGG